MHRWLGRSIEWTLSYQHEVVFETQNKYQYAVREQHRGEDAGFDLFVSKDTKIPPGQVADVPTGVYLSPKDKLWFHIFGRSSTFRKRGLIVNIAVIDHGYRGELFAIAHNFTNKTVKVFAGERICQIVPHRLIPCRFSQGELAGSKRGKGGFGSTGL